MFVWNWIPRESGEVSTQIASLRGYLYKYKREQKLLTTQWVKRYFVVEGYYLRYYNSEPAPGQTYKGSIDLKTVTGIEKFSHSSSLTLVLNIPERNLMLRASTIGELDKWYRLLLMQIDLSKGGDGRHVICSGNEGKKALLGEKDSYLSLKTNSTSVEIKPVVAAEKRDTSLSAEIDRTIEVLNELEVVAIDSEIKDSGSGNYSESISRKEAITGGTSNRISVSGKRIIGKSGNVYSDSDSD